MKSYSPSRPSPLRYSHTDARPDAALETQSAEPTYSWRKHQSNDQPSSRQQEIVQHLVCARRAFVSHYLVGGRTKDMPSIRDLVARPIASNMVKHGFLRDGLALAFSALPITSERQRALFRLETISAASLHGEPLTGGDVLQTQTQHLQYLYAKARQTQHLVEKSLAWLVSWNRKEEPALSLQEKLQEFVETIYLQNDQDSTMLLRNRERLNAMIEHANDFEGLLVCLPNTNLPVFLIPNLNEFRSLFRTCVTMTSESIIEAQER